MAKPTSVRFPEPLRERLSARAAAERRTFSNLVVLLSAAALDARGDSMPTEDRWRRDAADDLRGGAGGDRA
jgi:CopG-like RHH_1 or ribbon-helix-helix domain, RHH_5